MPRKLSTVRVPKYRLHRSTGQGVVTIHGKECYLGKHGSKASWSLYQKLIAETLSSGTSPLALAEVLTLDEVLAAFWRHAKTYYVKGILLLG